MWRRCGAEVVQHHSQNGLTGPHLGVQTYPLGAGHPRQATRTTAVSGGQSPWLHGWTPLRTFHR